MEQTADNSRQIGEGNRPEPESVQLDPNEAATEARDERPRFSTRHPHPLDDFDVILPTRVARDHGGRAGFYQQAETDEAVQFVRGPPLGGVEIDQWIQPLGPCEDFSQRADH